MKIPKPFLMDAPENDMVKTKIVDILSNDFAMSHCKAITKSHRIYDGVIN